MCAHARMHKGPTVSGGAFGFVLCLFAILTHAPPHGPAGADRDRRGGRREDCEFKHGCGIRLFLKRVNYTA